MPRSFLDDSHWPEPRPVPRGFLEAAECDMKTPVKIVRQGECYSKIYTTYDNISNKSTNNNNINNQNITTRIVVQ
jgi:hypothetical protein